MSIDAVFHEVFAKLGEVFDGSAVIRLFLAIPIMYFVIRIPFRLVYGVMTGRTRRTVHSNLVFEPEPEKEPFCDFQCSDTSCPWHESKKYCEQCNRFQICMFCSAECERRKG